MLKHILVVLTFIAIQVSIVTLLDEHITLLMTGFYVIGGLQAMIHDSMGFE